MVKTKKIVKVVKKGVKAVNKVGRALGHLDLSGSAGAAVGGKIGKKLGSQKIGRDVGRFIGSAIGKGDYVVSSNALGRASANLGAQAPTFSKNQESTIIEHREYIGDLVSSATPGAFSLVKYKFNPTNSKLFPWLSTIAENYEQYEPLGAIVTFKSTSSEYNATGQALGTVIIASDYDVYDALYANKVEMENSTFAVSCRPSESMMHPIECDPKQRATRLLYTGDAQNANDGRFHDLCNIQVASVGISTASVTLGEIWISYKIRLHKPQVSNAGSYALIVSGTAYNPNNASNVWGALTENPGCTNRLSGKVTFTTAGAGNARLNFVDPVCFNKYFIVVKRADINTNTAFLNSLTITPTDTQVTLLYVTNGTTPNSYAGQNTVSFAVLYVTKDPNTSVLPSINFTWAYYGVDYVSSVGLHIHQLDDSQLAV